jgi:hypothetical protein
MPIGFRIVDADNLSSISVIGDTTSPVSDLTYTSAHLKDLAFLIEKYGDDSFAATWPTALFTELININHLRMRASELHPAMKGDLTKKAFTILSRVSHFSPKNWVESKPVSKEDWVCLAHIYQAAMILYCIRSLQGVFVLPSTAFLEGSCMLQGQSLQRLLSKALLSPRIQGLMLWPLIVLGMEAVNGGAGMRAFTEVQLERLCQSRGMYMPTTGKKLLRKFWDSGETTWDACFDQSYAFAVPPAVDASGLD